MNKFYILIMLVCSYTNIGAHTTLKMVDPDATAETKALYANLWAIQQRGFMFGHHDDLNYGRHWQGVKG